MVVVRVEVEGWAHLSSGHSPPHCDQRVLQKSGWLAEALEN